MPFTPDNPLDDILDDPRINDGIHHILVKDTGKTYELYNGQWVEAYDGDLVDQEYEYSVELSQRREI